MKLISRFRKGKKSDGADSQDVADLDEGLLMPTAPAQPSADSGGNSQADVDAMPPAAESGEDEDVNSRAEVDAMLAAAGSGSGDSEASAAPAEDDDLLAAAQGGANGEGEDDVDDLTAAAQTSPATDEIKPEAPAEADAADDDPLSAFKTDEVFSDLADLTKGIEEIAIGDLLEQVRDVRGMLPATPAEDDNAA